MDYESQRVEFWTFYEDRLSEFYKRLQQTQKRAIPNRHKGLYRTSGLGKDFIAHKICVRYKRGFSQVQDFFKRQTFWYKVLPYFRLKFSQGRNFLQEWLRRSSNFAR